MDALVSFTLRIKLLLSIDTAGCSLQQFSGLIFFFINIDVENIALYRSIGNSSRVLGPFQKCP